MEKIFEIAFKVRFKAILCNDFDRASRNNWWSMPANSGNSTNFCNVNNNGNPNNNNASNSNGAPV